MIHSFFIFENHKKKSMKRLVNGRRCGKACVHYRIEWAGEQWKGQDTWEPLDSL